MIDLNEWSDYQKSINKIESIKYHLSAGRFCNLAKLGAKNCIKSGVILPEDADYALRLIGEKKIN